MSVPIAGLFDSDNPNWAPKGSRPWNEAIFKRAYYGNGDPFDKVCQRLRRGFSVLVYLPGNSMAAAADVVMSGGVGEGQDWIELIKPSTGTESFADVLRHTVSMGKRITAWLTHQHTRPPTAIFHNLDLLSDGRGGMDPSPDAKTALLYLVDSVRSGVVLGLSDRDAGELPAVLRRPFAEEIWLDQVPVDRFKRLIPLSLGRLLDHSDGHSDGVPEGVAWLIASRLRWTDPIRAVRIMDQVAGQVGDRGSPKERVVPVLKEILAATQTVQFRRPDEIEEVDLDPKTDLPTGFESGTIKLLQNNVILPFRGWAGFSGSEEECRHAIRRLPPGLILHGPPGTGKSALARWVSKSIRLPIRQVRAANLIGSYWGETERNVRELFRSARRAAPCVIVMDDADDLLPDRRHLQGSETGGAERGMVNAFLQELEGFGRPLEGVLVILTTNRFDQLDQAAKTRLPLHLPVPYPLDAGQVRAIVRAVAKSYGVELAKEGPEENRLAERFMGPVRPATGLDFDNPEWRRVQTDNLFSPREIRSAMRLLVGPSGNRPSDADVERMESYFRSASIPESNAK